MFDRNQFGFSYYRRILNINVFHMIMVFLNNLPEHSLSLLIDNEILGVPQIQCTDKIVFNIQTKNPFRGNIYVRGQFGVQRCRKEFYLNNAPGASFEIGLGDCGMTKMRQLQPTGIGYTVVVMTLFHPLFVTKVDRSFKVRCFYAQALIPVDADLKVNEQPSVELGDATGVIWPKCEYSVRQETVDGPVAREVRIGDPIVHRWKCDNANFGMLVKDCVVSDGGSETVNIIDERGCPTKGSVIQERVIYDDSLTLAFVPILAYSFPDRLLLNFHCKIQVCSKQDNECMGVTPPNCPTISPDEFLPSSIVNANVDPTRIISTFENANNFNAAILPYPTQYPTVRYNSYPSTPFVSLFSPAHQQRLPYSSYRRKSDAEIPTPTAIDSLSRQHQHDQPPSSISAPDLQILKRPSRMPQVHESSLFRQVSDGKVGEDATTTLGNGTVIREDFTDARSKNARTRRDEKTLDVATDVYVVKTDMPENTAEEELLTGDGATTRHRFFTSNENSLLHSYREIGRDEYCVNQLGLVMLVALLAVLTSCSIVCAAYTFNDVVVNRYKRGKGIIAGNRRAPDILTNGSFGASDRSTAFNFRPAPGSFFPFPRLS